MADMSCPFWASAGAASDRPASRRLVSAARHRRAMGFPPGSSGGRRTTYHEHRRSRLAAFAVSSLPRVRVRRDTQQRSRLRPPGPRNGRGQRVAAPPWAGTELAVRRSTPQRRSAAMSRSGIGSRWAFAACVALLLGSSILGSGFVAFAKGGDAGTRGEGDDRTLSPYFFVEDGDARVDRLPLLEIGRASCRERV